MLITQSTAEKKLDQFCYARNHFREMLRKGKGDSIELSKNISVLDEIIDRIIEEVGE